MHSPTTTPPTTGRRRSDRLRALGLLALTVVFAIGYGTSGMSPAGAAGTGTVSGVVRTTGGTKIPGTTVHLPELGLIGVTDANGVYSIPNVPDGSHAVHINPPCRQGVTTGVAVSGATTRDFVSTYSRLADGFGHACTLSQFALVPDSSALALSGDDEAVTVGLPFGFPFYGSTRTSMKVSTNGYLTFGPSDGRSPLNGSVFSSITPLDSIFPFWDDLVVDASASVVTGSTGTAPNRVFMVEWRNVAFFDAPGNRLSFQVQLFEDGNIAMAWRDVGPTLRERGSSATIGLRNSFPDAGRDGVEILVSSDRPVITDQLRVTWPANAPFPHANAGPDREVPSGAAFVLDGSASTGPATRRYAWRQVSGPVTTITDGNQAKATVQGQTGPRTLTYALTVSDDFARSTTDEVTITVAPK